MALPEKEMVGWICKQLGSSSLSQTDLCAAYQKELGRSEDELMHYITESKYFRKTGSEGNWSWTISANRKNDLRDLLAE